MPFVLSIVHAPVNGAAYGKAVVLEPVEYCAQASYAVARALINAPQHVSTKRAKAWAKRYFDTDYVTGTEHTHQLTGLTFRIDQDDHAPNACPCCGRLVNFQDHALAGSDDAYCLGCYTWGDRNKVNCNPKNSAHHNPWGTTTKDARWHLEVVIDHGDEMVADDRYSPDDELFHDDPIDAALVAWSGLTRDQIIEATLAEITRNDAGECANGSPSCTTDDPCVVCYDKEN